MGRLANLKKQMADEVLSGDPARARAADPLLELIEIMEAAGFPDPDPAPASDATEVAPPASNPPVIA